MRQTRKTWALEEFGGAKIDDRRWLRRLVQMATVAALRPAGKVTDVFCNDAQRQGAYGLLESEAVGGDEVASAMFEASARRCADEQFVFCALDGTSLTLTDLEGDKDFGSVGARAQKARGLKVINALTVSGKGVPLGLTAQVWWARPEKQRKKHRDQLKPEQKEIARWIDAAEQTRRVMQSHAPDTKLWFQVDREGDAWPIIEQADQGGHWFTIRGNHNRRVVLPDGKTAYLRDVLAGQPEVTTYQLAVSAGARRSERTAKMVVRTCSTTLDLRDKRTSRHFLKKVNVVLAREQGTTPTGEKPIEWMLLTSRPIETAEQAQQVVLGYAQRWRIEDFHRTWKSGACRVEESQLRSQASVVKWATILAAVAVRIDRIKLLSRKEPDRPATDEFTPIEIRAITLLRFGGSAKTRSPNSELLTLGQATLWVAQIGGYTGKSSGGPPGSATLARGLKELATAVRTLKALRGDCD